MSWSRTTRWVHDRHFTRSTVSSSWRSAARAKVLARTRVTEVLRPSQTQKNTKRAIISSGQRAGERGVFTLAEVRLQEGEPLENALRRFKRKVQQEDIIKEVKRHSFYLKPGEKKRVKEALARKRNRKKIRKEQD